MFFVILSQVKINVVNVYSGSLSWSNFFSRILHWHPGRVVWIFFNVGIALTLMEVGAFGFLNTVLGFYSNVAIAWIAAFYNAFGEYAQAFSPFIAIAIAFALSPLFAILTKGRYYIARPDTLESPMMVDGQLSAEVIDCTVCRTGFERPDMAGCPFHSKADNRQAAICSLCCRLEKSCHDMCKKPDGQDGRVVDLTLSPSAPGH